MGSKRIAESRVTLSMMMGPEHANVLGNVHGGIIMKLADEAGALAAIRHARSAVVTVAVDSMTFLEPILVGNVVTLHAQITYAGKTSMEVAVKVLAENPITGETTRTNTAYLVYVAVDERKRPRPVPGLIAETPEEAAALQEARQRQSARKQRMPQKEDFV